MASETTSPASPGPPALVSTEIELPVVASASGEPAPPEVFLSLWPALAGSGWTPSAFGVTRPSAAPGPCISSDQAFSTDTGPLFEIAPSPTATVGALGRQLGPLLDVARDALGSRGYSLLGSGVHPTLRAIPEHYYRYRTPRPAYDYAIRERGWKHWTILDKAAVQELVDVPFRDAPRAVRVLHRLAGLMNFLLRNDPDLHGDYGGRLSVRPIAWKDHVPHDGPFAADAVKTGMPDPEVDGWRSYLSLLWERCPMFLIGTKGAAGPGLAWVLEHPAFLRFLREAPPGGWTARTLSGEVTHVVPDLAHVAQSDWTYLGYARIRWKWRAGATTVARLVEAWDEGEIEAVLEQSLEKVVIESRGSSSQPPGEALVSVALVAGLLAALDEAETFAMAEPYTFWRTVLEASTTAPLDTEVEGRAIPSLARTMVAIARGGLERRGEPGPAGLLSPLEQRIEEKLSPAERLLREYRRGGVAAVLRLTTI